MANGVEEHGARLKTVESELERLRKWRHETYTEQYNVLLLKLVKMENSIDNIGKGGMRAWEIARPVITTIITGFLLWLAVVLLKLYPAMKSP